MIKNKQLNRELYARQYITRVKPNVFDSIVLSNATSLNLTIPPPIVNTGIGFGIIGVNFKVG